MSKMTTKFKRAVTIARRHHRVSRFRKRLTLSTFYPTILFSVIPKGSKIKVVARYKGKEIYTQNFQENIQVEEAWKEIFDAVKSFFCQSLSSVRQA